MSERVNQQAGTAATLHALRHTAAFQMAEDPSLPLTSPMCRPSSAMRT